VTDAPLLLPWSGMFSFKRIFSGFAEWGCCRQGVIILGICTKNRQRWRPIVHVLPAVALAVERVIKFFLKNRIVI
jgi:hypothetical protein